MNFYFHCISDCIFDIKDSNRRHHFKKGDEFLADFRFCDFLGMGEPAYLVTNYYQTSSKCEKYYMTADELNKYFSVEVTFF